MVSEQVRAACESHVGRRRVIHDSLAPENAEKLATLLECDFREALRTTWHWAYFNPALAARDVGHDGHERLGLFMPPAPFLRRMWAGGTVDVIKPLRLCARAEKHSQITDVVFKSGASGGLCFVTVQHEIYQDQLAIREHQTIVYRDRGMAVSALREPNDPVPDGYIVLPDTSLLAYSAITQNGHRIHWDRDFCRDVEGYPGLVVHGPLLATLLADALMPVPVASRFSYRATAPVFETTPFRLDVGKASARVIRADAQTAMEASIG